MIADILPLQRSCQSKSRSGYSKLTASFKTSCVKPRSATPLAGSFLHAKVRTFDRKQFRSEIRVDLYRKLSKAVSRHPQLQHNVRDICKEQFEQDDRIRPRVSQASLLGRRTKALLNKVAYDRASKSSALS